MEEDVGRFQIPVNDAKGIETLITSNNLSQNLDGLCFSEFFLELYELAQIPTLAEVCDYVCFVFIATNLMHVQQIRFVFNQV